MIQKNNPEYWDNKAEDYSTDKLFNLVKAEPMTQYMLKYFPRKSKVLDAGCGDGRFAFYLIKNGYNVQGIDFSKRKIELCKKHAKELGLNEKIFNIGNVLNMRFKDSSFDVLLVRGVLNH